MAKVDKNGVLRGQVAVVTGASRGIGEAIARRFAMEGAKVVVSARTVEAEEHYLPGTIKETVEHINKAGGEAIAVRADLAKAEDRKHLIQAAQQAFGGVDILVNNAAITYFIPVEDFPEKRFRLMMDVQVWAPFELSQLVIPGMKERGHGDADHDIAHGAGQLIRDKGEQNRGETDCHYPHIGDDVADTLEKLQRREEASRSEKERHEDNRSYNEWSCCQPGKRL